jgi:hypothetical protein
MELSGPSLHKLLHTTMECFDHGRRLGIAHDVASAMRCLTQHRAQGQSHGRPWTSNDEMPRSLLSGWSHVLGTCTTTSTRLVSTATSSRQTF